MAPNSPLANKLSMGDIITKVNQYTICTPEDLSRVIMVSGKNLIFEYSDCNNNEKIFEVTDL